MIAGLDKPDMGSLVVGETVDVMYVDQNREGLDDPELSVFDAVTDGAEEINLGPRTINRCHYHFRSSRVRCAMVDDGGVTCGWSVFFVFVPLGPALVL